MAEKNAEVLETAKTKVTFDFGFCCSSPFKAAVVYGYKGNRVCKDK